MNNTIRIGTRESELAMWQANLVASQLKNFGYPSVLVQVKSEGDIDLQTPLYEMGVQGIFTRSLDVALLNRQIDIAVHSYKDVPTQLPEGLVVAAVLERGNHRDLLVFHPQHSITADQQEALQSGVNMPEVLPAPFLLATSSIRRKAQWLAKMPGSTIENIRGNINTRMKKMGESNWHAAIFAAAGLERINLRPQNAIELNWMLPAPAQGAIVVVCREEDIPVRDRCSCLNDVHTAVCTRLEREFLRTLLGGCSTPISAWARVVDGMIHMDGNIAMPDGSALVSVSQQFTLSEAEGKGHQLGSDLLKKGGQQIIDQLKHA